MIETIQIGILQSCNSKHAKFIIKILDFNEVNMSYITNDLSNYCDGFR
jgi:hypothetical protein